MVYKESEFKCTWGDIDLTPHSENTTYPEVRREKLWYNIVGEARDNHIVHITLDTGEVLVDLSFLGTSAELHYIKSFPPSTTSPFVDFTGNGEAIDLDWLVASNKDQIGIKRLEPIDATSEFVGEESIKALKSAWEELHVGTVMSKDLDTLAEIPVRNINLCKYNDCGWCYYKGDLESNDEGGQCNSPQQCKVNIGEK